MSKESSSPAYMAIHVVVLAGLVLAVTFLVFQSRALTFRLNKLEAAADRTSATPEVKPRVLPTEMASTPDETPTPVERVGPTQAPVHPPSKTEKPAPLAEATVDLSPAQEQAVAKAVDRIIQEKYGHLPKMAHPEDVEKLLEKELGLTESQKLRIADIFKWKRDELRAVFEKEPGITGKAIGKSMAIEKRADEMVRAELDSTQQAKYDQLKKDGKISPGVTIQIDATDTPEKD